MKRGSTLFLRAVVIILGLIMLVLCAWALPAGILSDKTGYFKPILWGLYVPAVPFYFALYQALKLLGYIDKSQAFTQSAVDALRNIKYSGLAISGLFAAGMPYIFYAADRDDAPGIVLMACMIVGLSFVVAVAAGVFQGLLQNAVDIKSENDLTV